MMRPVLLALVVALAVGAPASPSAREQSRIPASTGSPAAPAGLDDVLRQAFRAAYNLEYADAIATARQAVLDYPEASSAHRTLASVLWLSMIFSRGACMVDYFLSGVTSSRTALPKAPPALEAEFKNELGLAVSLADARLKDNPKDVDARHDIGAAYAIQASYAASVDGSMTAAFRSAKRAYDAQEEVLERQPGRADAIFTIGLYRYLVSALSLPARFVAYLAGFGGGKERGISMLESTLDAADVHVDTRAALLLIYTREGRHLDALRVVRELATEFPRNRLFLLESGAVAIRAGRAEEAEATLTRGLGLLATDTRPNFPGERAVWIYKRGMARVNLNHLADAQADLDAAMASQPLDWVKGRIRLEMGKIADLSGRRTDAVAVYRDAKTICARNEDTGCVNRASDLIKKAFHY